MGHKTVTFKPISLIALGANLPIDETGPDVTLRKAIAALRDSQMVVSATSRVFKTPCFPAGAGPDYVNAAIAVQSALAPVALLEKLHVVENAFGRARKVRWASRTLDLDLIARGDCVYPDNETYKIWQSLPLERQMKERPRDLVFPHPRVQDRAFVLVPLLDIAPDWRHPVLGKTVTEMVAALPKAEVAAVKPL